MGEKRAEAQARYGSEKLFGYVEDTFYLSIAVSLVIAGAILFGSAAHDFVTNPGSDDMPARILSLLDKLLLVFIITELIHTLRNVIAERVLISEPFLVVGVVAAIRRLVVVSAGTEELLGTPEFAGAMVEMGILTGAILLIGATIFLLRHTEHSEPHPAHEPE